MIWLLLPLPLPVSRVLRNHMVYCGQMANSRTASHWSLGREANLWSGTLRPYVLWLIHVWQQRQRRPAQQLNVRLSSKSPNSLVWRISVSSSQLRWNRLVHSMRQLVSFWRISGEGYLPSQVTRECLPVPNVICCHSAIQRYLAPQQFWGGRPPGLTVIPAFTFS